jgi:hypothetical protein
MTRFVGVGKETTFKTQVALTAYVNAIDENYSLDNSVDMDFTMGTRFKEKPAPGPFNVKGGFKCYAEQENIGLLLAALMGAGSDTVTVPESGVYLHTMVPKESPVPLTIAVGSDVTGGQKSMPGSTVKKLKVTIAPKGKIICDFETCGATAKIDSLATPTFSTKKVYHNVHSVLKIGGSQVARIKSMTLEIENQVSEDDFAHGSRELYSTNFGGLIVKGTMDLFFDSVDQFKYFMGGATAVAPANYLTPQAIAIEITHNELAGATQYYCLKFQMGEAIYKTHKANVNKRERTIENIEYEMQTPVAGGNPFTILYQNTQVTAYV